MSATPSSDQHSGHSFPSTTATPGAAWLSSGASVRDVGISSLTTEILVAKLPATLKHIDAIAFVFLDGIAQAD
jgi:hypothetical protein